MAADALQIPIFDISSGRNMTQEEFIRICTTSNKFITIDDKLGYLIKLQYGSVLYNCIFYDNLLFLYDDFFDISIYNVTLYDLRMSSFLNMHIDDNSELNISTVHDFRTIESFSKLETIFILLISIAKFFQFTELDIADAASVLCKKPFINPKTGEVITDGVEYDTLYYRIFADQKPLEELSIYNKFFAKKRNFAYIGGTKSYSYKNVREYITNEKKDDDDLTLLQNDLQLLRTLHYKDKGPAIQYFKDFVLQRGLF